MKTNPRSTLASELSCDVCGQLPQPQKSRLTVANVATMLPIELFVHAAVVNTDLPYVLKVLVLTVTATVLVIWVAEPSAMRLLRGWLHAPALRRRKRLDTSAALWRVRTTVRDEPGALERLTHSLGRLDANILTIHVHPVAGGVLDELVLSTPGHITDHALIAAIDASGGRHTHAWPTTALALADGQTKALSLAVRVAANPRELPLAAADLLGAKVVRYPAGVESSTVDGGATLKIPSITEGAIILTRPGDPFTPAESARAHRLAELAELVDLS